jgi:hypothetical protein
MLHLIAMFAMQTTTEPAAQLDFWVGEWECTGRSRNAPGKDEWTETKCTNSIKKILGGKVIEENFSTQGFTGKSVSVYNANAKVWQQTWVDSSGGYIALSGGVENGSMTLNQVMGPNAPTGLRMRMVFKDVKQDSFTWDWERSTDGGKTWELQWRLDYKRKK